MICASGTSEQSVHANGECCQEEPHPFGQMTPHCEKLPNAEQEAEPDQPVHVIQPVLRRGLIRAITCTAREDLPLQIAPGHRQTVVAFFEDKLSHAQNVVVPVSRPVQQSHIEREDLWPAINMTVTHQRRETDLLVFAFQLIAQHQNVVALEMPLTGREPLQRCQCFVQFLDYPNHSDRCGSREKKIGHVATINVAVYAHFLATHEATEGVEYVSRDQMLEDGGHVVQQPGLFEGAARVTQHLQTGIAEQDGEGDALNVAPRYAVQLTRRAVVDHDLVAGLCPRVPRCRNHQVDHSVHGDQVSHGVGVVQHGSHYALPDRQHQSSGTVNVVDPATNWFSPRRSHDGWSDDGDWQVFTLLRQQRLSQCLCVCVSVWPITHQFGCYIVHHRLVHPLHGIDDLLGLGRWCIQNFVHLCPIAVGIRSRNMNQSLQSGKHADKQTRSK